MNSIFFTFTLYLIYLTTSVLASCGCQTCDVSPGKFCPSINGTSGCSLTNLETTCSCNSGGQCFSTLGSCIVHCLTEEGEIEGQIKAELEGSCDPSVERSISNPSSTNNNGYCNVSNCILNLIDKKLSCTIQYDFEDLNEEITDVHIHWTKTGNLAAGKYDFPTSSFVTGTSAGTVNLNNADGSGIFFAMAIFDEGTPTFYVNLHSDDNSAGSIAGILKPKLLEDEVDDSSSSSNKFDNPLCKIFILLLTLFILF